MMRKLLVILAAALLLVGVFAMSAQATANFDFFINPPQTGASISYAGGVNPLIGEDIIVTGVSVTGAPISGVFAIDNGVLNFTTGNFTGSDPLHWNFGPGGSIAYSGDILNVGGNPSTFTSLQGQFTSAVVAQTIPSTVNHVVIGEYTDTKSFDLLDLFGIDPTTNPWAGALNLSFTTALAIGPGADGSQVPFTSSSVGSGDFTNVPVPPSLVLLGSGLLGLAGLRFRKNRA